MSQVIIFVIIIAIGLFWVGTESIAERVVALRMFLFFAAGLIAFSIPFLLFPDPYSSTLQLGNVSVKGIGKHIFQRSSLLGKGILLLIFVICFGDLHTPLANLSTKFIYLGMGVSTFMGLYLLGVSRYTRSGIDSQFWKESEKGREMRRKFADYLKYPLDPGAIPSLINTVLITSVGMIAVSIGAVLYNSFGAISELIPAVLVLMFGLLSYRKTRSGIHQYYYATNAFFREFFGVTIKGKEEKEKVQVHQLWWVPKPLKSQVWALLLQLDRKFPAGRVLLLGHLMVWFISYQRPGADTMVSLWLLFALIHHAIIVISMLPEFAPVWWQGWIGSTTNWILSRFWMQFRWILLLAVSVYLNSWLFGYPSFESQLLILAVYIVSSFLVSLAGSLFQKRKSYN